MSQLAATASLPILERALQVSVERTLCLRLHLGLLRRSVTGPDDATTDICWRLAGSRRTAQLGSSLATSSRSLQPQNCGMTTDLLSKSRQATGLETVIICRHDNNAHSEYRYSTNKNVYGSKCSRNWQVLVSRKCAIMHVRASVTSKIYPGLYPEPQIRGVGERKGDSLAKG
jgi:hypothetical protein